MNRSRILAAASVTFLSCAPRLGPPPEIPPPPQGATILVGAGDIAQCGIEADEGTAKLLDRIEGTVFTLGDNAYESGTAEEYAACYEPTWGRHKARTKPSAGNHDWITPGAKGFFEYYGLERSWYSYEAGGWHVVVLDSNCKRIDCAAQAEWLKADLAASDAKCTLAYWHHPRWSSGPHGNDASVDPFWRLLAEHGADVVLAGHDHHYERFAPLDAKGQPDPKGIRSFVVGTGGRNLRPVREAAPGSEVRDDRTHGVLRLALFEDRYEWTFVPIASGGFTDAGAGQCH